MTAIEPSLHAGARPGRRRSHAADDAILAATLEVVREHGYGALTMAAVIVRAGVSSATLYRRWATKHDLVIAALETVEPEELGTDTGSLVGDIAQFTKRARAAIEGGWAELAEAIGVAAKRDPDLSAALRDRFLAPRIARLSGIIDRAVQRGELASAPEPELALSLIVGPLHHHAIVLGMPLTDAFLEAARHQAVAGLKGLNSTSTSA
jgi:AcrR family transcriptional regulator